MLELGTLYFVHRQGSVVSRQLLVLVVLNDSQRTTDH